MTEPVDCTQYLALSKKTGELITRGGRPIVAAKSEWSTANWSLVGALVPCPVRPFGAVDLLRRPESEVTVAELEAMLRLRPILDDFELAKAIHARVYGPKRDGGSDDSDPRPA